MEFDAVIKQQDNGTFLVSLVVIKNNQMLGIKNYFLTQEEVKQEVTCSLVVEHPGLFKKEDECSMCHHRLHITSCFVDTCGCWGRKE